MKFFIDTEFIESGYGRPIHLLSLGAVSENGDEFYGFIDNAPLYLAGDFVKRYVLPFLDPVFITMEIPAERDIRVVKKDPMLMSHEFMLWVRQVAGGEKPEFWGYYCDYDWVVLCQSFGAMVSLPDDWPKFCMDIKQRAVEMGNPDLPREHSPFPHGPDVHNALLDARWNKTAWEFLQAMREENAILSAR